MNQVQALYNVTTELFALLQSYDTTDRDAAIEQIEAFLDKREGLLATLKGPYNEEEKKLGRDIIEMNQTIDAQLAMIMAEVKRDINVQKKKRETQNKYINPYQNVQTIDGMFYDKKK